MSLAESGSWTDPRQLFARLGGRVLGFQTCAQRVLTAEGIEDLILEVRGEPAAMLNIYIFDVIYRETMGHEAITLERCLSLPFLRGEGCWVPTILFQVPT